jgi:hypothetical protein
LPWSGAQLVEQRLGLLQIQRIEPLREPAVDRSQQFASLLRLALVAPEACEACARASQGFVSCSLAYWRDTKSKSRISQEHIRGCGPVNQRFVKVLLGGQEHNVLTRVMGNTEEHGNASVNGPAVFFWPAMVRP